MPALQITGFPEEFYRLLKERAKVRESKEEFKKEITAIREEPKDINLTDPVKIIWEDRDR